MVSLGNTIRLTFLGAVLPIYVMLIASVFIPARHSHPVAVEWHFPDRLTAGPCVADALHGQRGDGSEMFVRDREMRLSRCWLNI